MAHRQEGTSVLPGDPSVPGPMAHLAGECHRVGEVLARIGDKWSVMIIMLLRDSPMRFNDLKRSIGGISQRMLTVTLRALEREGIVNRTVSPSIPPRVEYALTHLGDSLRVPVEALGQWAFGHLDEIDEARRRFDENRDS